jgi:hypothetical protein
MPGLFVHDPISRHDRGTTEAVVIEIRVCANCGLGPHLAQEARHKARALRSEGACRAWGF